MSDSNFFHLESTGEAMILKKKQIAVLVGQACAALTLATAAQISLAQEGSTERVTVTGSNIKRVAAEAPTAVQVISSKDIEKTGATTANEVFLNLASFSAYNDEVAVTSAPSRSTMGFRNFDASNVLVLVNGRRVARNAVNGQAYDLNSIPMSALERVEILKDGAAAIYGSDAVAGVVNFVMRRNFQGAEVSGTAGETSYGDGTEKRVSAAIGYGDLNTDGYNVLLTVDGFRRDIVMRRNRDASFKKVVGQYNEAAPTGNIYAPQTGGKYEPINPCPETLVSDNLGTYCPYYFNQDINLIPGTERTGMFLSFTKKLSADANFFAEYMKSKVNTFNSFSAPPGSFAASRAPLILASDIVTQAGTLIPAGTYASGTAKVRIRFDQNGVRRFIIDSEAERWATGVEGRRWDVDYSFDVGHSSTKTSELSTGFFDYATAQKDQAAGRFDPFAPGLSASDLAPYNVAGTNRTRSSLDFVNFRGSKDLFPLAGGQAAVAAGVSFNAEKLEINPDELTASGRVSTTGSPVAPLPETTRRLKSFFVEMSLPFMKGLETQVALRYDSYSDVGSVTTPKVAAKYTVTPNFALRGSYAEGFVAPDLELLYKPGESESAEFVRDNAACAEQNIVDCAANQVTTYFVSNPNLKPERSKTFALGAVFSPMKDLDLAVDAFKIEKTGRIGSSLQYILDHPDAIVGGQLASSYVTRAAAIAPFTLGAIDYALVPYQNIGLEQSTGVEVSAQYKMMALGGQWAFNNELSYYFSYKRAQAPGAQLEEYIGLMDTPEYRNVFSVGYSTGPWFAGVTARTLGGFYDATEPTEVDSSTAKVPAWTTFDLQASYQGILSKNDKFVFGVKNAADKKVISTLYDNNAGFPASQNALGRFTYVSYSYKF
jgi:iron complex outermembrane receptor protein